MLAFLGAALSVALSSLVLLAMSHTPSIKSMLPVKFTWTGPSVTMTIALLLGFAGGMASAVRASELNVLDGFGRE